MTIFMIFLLTFLIEAVIQIIKPIWGQTKIGDMSLTEVISMVAGIAIAVFGKLNILAEIIQTESMFLQYVFYVITGLAMGRGTSFLHDLWLKLRSGYWLPPGNSK